MRGARVCVAIATLAVGVVALTQPIAFGAGSDSASGAASRPRGVQVRTVAIHQGVNKLSVSVRQTFGVRPPAILFKTIPGRVGCRVLGYGYTAHQASLERPPVGKLTMRLKCGRVPSTARVQLQFRAPIQRVFALRNGPGSVHVVLDVPRGRTLPLLELGIRPPGRGTCRNLGRSLSVRGDRFDLRIRGRCRGLRRGTEGVLSIGGLLLNRFAGSSSASSRAAVAANAVARVAVVKSLTDKDGGRVCQSSEGKLVIQCTQTLEMWWGRTYSQELSQDCPSAWQYVSNGGYPGWDFKRVPDVGPTSDGNFAGLWTFSMWGIVSPPLKVVLSWRCDLRSPVNTANPPSKERRPSRRRSLVSPAVGPGT